MKTNRSDVFGPVSANLPTEPSEPEGALSATDGDNGSAGDASFLGGQRWSLRRKMAIVQRLLAGEPMELMSREIGVPIYQLEEWRDRAIAGMKAGLKTRPQDASDLQLKEAQRRIGELSMENELLRERFRRTTDPFFRGKSKK